MVFPVPVSPHQQARELMLNVRTHQVTIALRIGGWHNYFVILCTFWDAELLESVCPINEARLFVTREDGVVQRLALWEGYVELVLLLGSLRDDLQDVGIEGRALLVVEAPTHTPG